MVVDYPARDQVCMKKAGNTGGPSSWALTIVQYDRLQDFFRKKKKEKKT